MRARRPAVVVVGLVVLAVVAFAAPVASYLARSSAGTDPSADLGGLVVTGVEAGQSWGIYVDDPDNSGYGIGRCAVGDGQGGDVALRGAGASVSLSRTETLEFVFTTPEGGGFTVDCDVEQAAWRVGPAPSLTPLVIGGAAALALSAAALAVGVAGARRRRATTSSSGPTHWAES